MKNIFSRQELFIGKEKQEKLGKKKIVIAGCGALGSKTAFLLTRAGFGEITLIDKDFVEPENLGTQEYDEKDIGLLKVFTLKKKLEKINPKVIVRVAAEKISKDNIEKIIGKPDLVIDGTDNMLTRFLLNDFCVKNKIPWILGTCVKSKGMTFNILPRKACLRCVFQNIPSSTENPCDFGLLSTVPATISSIQAAEAVKILLKSREVSKDLIFYDAWKKIFEKVKVLKRKNCETCVRHDYNFLKFSEELLVHKNL